ncbi:MAG: hypothetical protein IPP18_16985 [Rhodocyclaceae bacterium]|nr:hypothetical protein [Rhodocyclaceae bacterium]
MIGTGTHRRQAHGAFCCRGRCCATPELHARLEARDSFYVGAGCSTPSSCTNRLWWSRHRQRPGDLLCLISMTCARILVVSSRHRRCGGLGMLDYFGEWPFIVRSVRAWKTATAMPSPVNTTAFSATTTAPGDPPRRLLGAVRQSLPAH